jgi:hypothetical protein
MVSNVFAKLFLISKKKEENKKKINLHFMKCKYVFNIREDKLSLLFDLFGTIDFAQLLQVIFNYELQIFDIATLHFY